MLTRPGRVSFATRERVQGMSPPSKAKISDSVAGVDIHNAKAFVIYAQLVFCPADTMGSHDPITLGRPMKGAPTPTYDF